VGFLKTVFYQNPVWLWFLAAAIAAAVPVVLWFIKEFLVRRLSVLAKRTKTDIDDFVIDLFGRTKLFFLILLGLYAGALALNLPPIADRVIKTLMLLSFLLQVGFWSSAVITFWIGRTAKRRLDHDPTAVTTIHAFGILGKIALWAILVLLALDNVGIKITSLIAGLGIGGIAIALAVQNILGDLFASLSIVFDKPFAIGDFIIVGDLMGTVERIGLKTTRVRSLSGEQLIFSNKDLLQSRIRNYKRMFERRVLFSIGVTYDTPSDKLKAIPPMIREIIEAQENTRFDRSHFSAYGDSSLNFETVYYVLVPDYNAYMDIQQAVNLAIYERFEELGIEFAFPTRTVYIAPSTGASTPEPPTST
jgi:small-conductance mechanosensitive channel